ncbi:MAG: hypothetical protein Unbinned3891contig1000_59 [Prokaryotic dsDNA virus sp.]|nr:MAG: hypothetical protein Unbinned3891contig1000_59 [Prokaryotic dsDNA virus sp.]|tara:strand:- start:60437 stop:60604 length:168 start_codon:yes stop_codon:yes gene_type:complete
MSDTTQTEKETIVDTPTVTDGFMKVQLILQAYTTEERKRICDAVQILLDDGNENK